MNGGLAVWLTVFVFAVTYFGLALGKMPWLHMDRAGIALVGATLMLVTGLLSLKQAVSTDSIDYRTLALLFGMMVVIAFLRLSGFFQWLTAMALQRIQTPLGLLAVTVILSGVLSAFLINDIVCLTMTPLVLHLARRLRFDPVPHLIALATAANIGSTGTITGNPQNIYIGSHSGISYMRFALRLMPVAGLGLVLNFLVVAFIYRSRLWPPAHQKDSTVGKAASFSTVGKAASFSTVGKAASFSTVGKAASFSTVGKAASFSRHEEKLAAFPTDSPAHRWLRRKSVVVTLVAVGLFFTGLPLELIALGAAALLLLGRVKPEKVYRQIDWGLLVMFTGLFIVVHAFQVHVVERWDIDGWDWLLARPVDLLSLVSAVLSNLVSNVPAVLLMEPVLRAMPAESQETAWLALAMSSTLAGNLTVLGSVANLIVVENASREGVRISFWEYCKVGVPLTIVTLILGIAWLELVY